MGYHENDMIENSVKVRKSIEIRSENSTNRKDRSIFLNGRLL
jgi:hypothetical protein